MVTAFEFPADLREFVDAVEWAFARSIPEWPHECIVRDRVDEDLFERLVLHIRANGYEGRYYEEKYTYFADERMVYWTMGAPLEETIIVNRCKEEDTYEYRSQAGLLPD